MSRKSPQHHIITPIARRQLMKEGAALLGPVEEVTQDKVGQSQNHAGVFEESPLMWRSEFDALKKEIYENLRLADAVKRHFGGPEGSYLKRYTTFGADRKRLPPLDKSENDKYIKWMDSYDFELCSAARDVLAGREELIKNLKQVEWNVRNKMEWEAACYEDDPAPTFSSLTWTFSPLDYFHQQCDDQFVGDVCGYGSLQLFRARVNVLREKLGTGVTQKLLGNAKGHFID